jgi:hypothetical protein
MAGLGRLRVWRDGSVGRERMGNASCSAIAILKFKYSGYARCKALE